MSILDNPLFSQYLQTERSQGRDGPFTEYEELVFGRFRARYENQHMPETVPPGVWYARGWADALKYLREQESSK